MTEIQQGDNHPPESGRRDQLTGSLSGPAIEGELTDALNRADLSPNAVGVIYADVDKLNEINDRFGRKAGDMVLRQVADALRSSFETYGKVGRIGDDEFLVVVTGTSLLELVELAESAAQLVAEAIESVDMLPNSTATLSMGIALNKENSRSKDELIDAAYTAMYRAKIVGRNQSDDR